jgi:hypothetical protein
MQIRKTQLLGVRLFLVLLLGFSQAGGAATQAPNPERAWNKIPRIVVLGQEGDWRNQLVIDASLSGINNSPRSVVVLVGAGDLCKRDHTTWGTRRVESGYACWGTGVGGTFGFDADPGRSDYRAV